MKHTTPTPSGTRAQIRIHGELHRKHFPHDTHPDTIRQWLLKTEMKYRGRQAKRTGRFDDDARAYLAAIAAMPTFAQRRGHIEEWIAAFGSRRRDSITPDEIRAQLHAWRTEPRTVKRGTRGTLTVTLSAAACNKRRTALMHMYSVLDGKSERNPVRDVPKFREPTPAPKAIPFVLVRKVFAAMPSSKAKARLMVLAFTGIPPGQIAQLAQADVDLKAGTVAVPGRKKGAGTPGRIVPLSADGIRAFKMMAREDAWGAFTMPPLRRAFQRASKRALGHTNVTPYALRHSFGTELYRASGDIRATQVLMGHSSPTLTHRYTLAAVDPRLLEALRKFGKR